MAAVIVTDNVGVTRMIDEGKSSVSRSTYFTLNGIFYTSGRNFNFCNLMRIAREILKMGQHDSTNKDFILKYIKIS